MEIVNDILTMAYYPFLDHLSYAHFEKWQDEVKAPSERKLTSTVITRLPQSITEKNRMDLFKLRAARLGKDELCGVDSTSISTYGINLVDIRWGRNKEHLPLRQTVEVVVYSMTSHQPIYYRELPGNMPDSRMTEMILTELEHAGFRNLVLIIDRGYESMKNLESYISKTLGVDLTPLEAMDTYGMRNEQEKCFALQKGLMFQDRLRVWSEASKHGRMFICFVGLILASYIRNVVKDNKELKDAYPSTESLMAEFRTIRCIEHNDRRKFITPFVGAQVDICKAFGFTIPEHCAPEYVSKKTPDKGRGRKPKPKTETQTY